MKKIIIHTGFLPDSPLEYSGGYIYRVKYTREGANGLKRVDSIHIVGDNEGVEFPTPVFSDKKPEGVGGIGGKIEIPQNTTPSHPLNGRIHQYYCIDNDVWIKNLGNLKYITEWTTEEKWGLAEEITCDENGVKISGCDLGFIILRNDRSRGISL